MRNGRMAAVALVALMGIAGCGNDKPTSSELNVIFQDDFEGSDCLGKWVVGGRRAEGTNTANCVEAGSSTKGHLFKSSYTEINLAPAGTPWLYSNDLVFQFDLRVQVSSTGGAPSNYFGQAGVFFYFISGSQQIGDVSYVAATTSFPFDQAASNPARAAVPIPVTRDSSYSLTVDEILSHIPSIDRSAITQMGMYFSVYSSTRPIPYVNGELWIDNVKVTGMNK
jgi:hypothetical protein